MSEKTIEVTGPAGIVKIRESELDGMKSRGYSVHEPVKPKKEAPKKTDKSKKDK